MIEIKGINKSFGDNHVLRDIDVTFESGKANLLIGASGSGKTTLCKCTVGLHSPDSGTISYDGRIFNLMSRIEKKEVRREIGFLFQGSALFDYMTVEENILFPIKMFSNLTKREGLDRVNFCLDRVDLNGANKLMPSELSGGMKKRVGIARAISAKPKYLFCDEPNSGLDPQTSILIDNLIKEITHEYNMTTVVITHDMNSVLEIGEHTSFIHKGVMLWDGTNKEIMDAETTELTDFVYASSFMKELKRMKG